MVDCFQEVHRYTEREIPQQFLTGFYLLSFSHTILRWGGPFLCCSFYMPPSPAATAYMPLVLARSATRSSDEIIGLDSR